MKADNKIEKAGKQEVTTPEGVERMETRRVFVPRVDVREKENETILLADMPGVSENTLDVMLEKNVLFIRGRVNREEFPGRGLAYQEYEVGDFERSFTISDEVDKENIQAKVKDGVLILHLPKALPKTKRITVTAM